jgi:hypothetical protein
MAAFVLVLIVLIVLSVTIIAMRKRTPPLKNVPIHPATFAACVRWGFTG